MRKYPFHAFLFALYPIVALLAHNIGELRLSSGYRSLLISLLAGIVLLLTLKSLQKDWLLAGITTSLILILFYSYGHVYEELKGVAVSGVFIFRHRTLLPLWLAVGLWAGWALSKKHFDVPGTNSFLNIMSLLLMIFPIYQIVSHMWLARIAESKTKQQGNVLPLSYSLEGTPPDIYYIILDGYPRSDVLKENLHVDNSAFLKSLRDMGFYVAECSQSNYSQTRLSLTSSLNFNYLDSLDNDILPENKDVSDLEALLRNNAVRRNLEKMGYKTVSFDTGFVWTEWKDADYYYEPAPDNFAPNEFEYLLLDTTALRVVQDNLPPAEQPSRSKMHRDRILYALDQIKHIPDLKGPKFVFLHLVIPHAPYVFKADGDELSFTPSSRDDINVAYGEQVVYISARMQEIIPVILKESAVPPVILIQGDHGAMITNPEMRMRNLSAYYLPNVDASLYNTITPVNSFRVVFNEYFGANLDLLPDVGYYSGYKKPYSFKEIPNNCH